MYESTEHSDETLAERVKHVVQSSFDGRRIVIFSGGAKSEDKNVFEEARAIERAEDLAPSSGEIPSSVRRRRRSSSSKPSWVSIASVRVHVRIHR